MAAALWLMAMQVLPTKELSLGNTPLHILHILVSLGNHPMADTRSNLRADVKASKIGAEKQRGPGLLVARYSSSVYPENDIF